MDESPDFFRLPDLTNLVKVSNPAPIFVGTYSHVIKGIYGGNLVAIKVLRPVSTTLHAMRRKLTREREVWSRLKHPNVVPLYGYIEESELFGLFGALVSPWYKNGDAAKYLQARGELFSLEERKDLWQGVVAGVYYLHGHSPVIIHGDLKPGNILIDDDGNPRICDFGLVHIFLEEGHSGMTTTSEHTGTERYLAPELVAADDGGRPTIASDIYALGCIGLEFLFLQLPYENRRHNRTGLIIKDIRDGIAPAIRTPTTTREESALWEILESCWNTTPSQRCDAGWLLRSLQSVDEGSSLASTIMSFLIEASRQGMDDVHIASTHSMGILCPDSSYINPVSHSFREMSFLNGKDIDPTFTFVDSTEDLSSVMDEEDDWLIVLPNKGDSTERQLHTTTDFDRIESTSSNFYSCSGAIQPYICSKCSYTFLNWLDLQTHMKVHPLSEGDLHSATKVLQPRLQGSPLMQV